MMSFIPIMRAKGHHGDIDFEVVDFVNHTFLMVALSPLFLMAASSAFDCSERNTTYAICYKALIIDMMSSLLSRRVNLA